MILLDLLFIVQSFAFDTQALRTPYFISSTTGETLIEVDHAGSIHFEKCRMVSIKFDSTVDAKNLASCEAITADLELKSETERQIYKYLISAELKKQMSRGWFYNLLGENYLVFSTMFATGQLLGFVIVKAKLPLLPSLIAGSVAVATILMKKIEASWLRIAKYGQFTKSVGFNEGLIPLIVSDDPSLIDLYINAVKNLNPQNINIANSHKN